MSRSMPSQAVSPQLTMALRGPSATLVRGVRPFSQSASCAVEREKKPRFQTTTVRSQPWRKPAATNAGDKTSDVSNLSSYFEQLIKQTPSPGSSSSLYGLSQTSETADTAAPDTLLTSRVQAKFAEPYHFHVLAHKHNTHITLTRPNREPILSISCGQLGFRKSGRKHYDSAFQLASRVLSKMRDLNLHNEIPEMEVILRGFGAGREAVTKALLGVDGAGFRQKVTRVTDATRLKFGGTRSANPRRLG